MKDSNKFMFTSDEIVRDVDRLCSTLIPVYVTTRDKFAKAAESIPALRECSHNELPELSPLRVKVSILHDKFDLRVCKNCTSFCRL